MRGRAAPEAPVAEVRPLQPAPAPEAKSAALPPIPIAAEAGGIYLQLGAFSSRDNAESFRAKMNQQMSGLNQTIGIFQREDGLYRLHLGPYRDRAEASGVSDKIREAMELKPVVVVR
jgi:rare lipoprotein A